MVELLVAVAAVLGLVMAAVPSLFDRLSGKSALEVVEDRISALPYRAASEQREIRVATGVELDLPEGWWITTDRPLVFTPDGHCTNASFVLRRAGAAFTYDLRPPACRPLRRN
jgi:hypothetical protein